MHEKDKEDLARAELVKLAADNNMYFVVWTGHFGYYFLGMRNSRNIKPEIYSAIYESVYDVISIDEELFRFNLNVKQIFSEISFSWIDVLHEVMPYMVESIVKNLGSKEFIQH